MNIIYIYIFTIIQLRIIAIPTYVQIPSKEATEKGGKNFYSLFNFQAIT